MDGESISFKLISEPGGIPAAQVEGCASNLKGIVKQGMASDAKEATPRKYAVMVGLAAAGILGGLAVLFATVAGFNPFAQNIMVTTYFASSEGLKSGAAVNLNGVTVGTVKRVDLSTAPARHKRPVEVTMKLNTKFLSGLHTDSLAELSSMGALADTVVDIDSQHATGPALQDGAELPTLNTPTVLDLKAGQDTMNGVHTLLDRLDPLVDQVETGKGSIGQFMSNPGLTKEATATIARAKLVGAKVDGTDSTAGKILNDHDITNKLAKLTIDTQALSASFSKLGNGPLQANITNAQTQANALSADVNAGHGAAGMIMKDAAFKKQMTDTAAATKGLLAGIDKGEGSAGKLLHDEAVKDNLSKLQTESADLAAKIRSNPKKYLTIEIRLF
jgi:phospholipid/cholesterol/gamma-HCH transport system substrate-binding protein